MLLWECLKIFFARIADVSLGTLRTVLCVKGKSIGPFIIAFFEVLIWYAVAREALNSTGNTVFIAISYALGYATGTLIGSLLSKMFIKGNVGVQIIIKENNENLIKRLRNKGYEVSVVELKNAYDGKNKDMLFIETANQKLRELTNIVKAFDKNAFLAVNDTKLVKNGFIK